MSYTAIALAAFDGGRGRVRLATRLLGYEKQAADQVKLLLGMELPEGALFKAADSLDMNLVFLVLLHLEHTTLHSLRRLPPSHSGIWRAATTTAAAAPPYMPEERKRLADFFAMVTVKPEAVALLALQAPRRRAPHADVRVHQGLHGRGHACRRKRLPPRRRDGRRGRPMACR